MNTQTLNLTMPEILKLTGDYLIEAAKPDQLIEVLSASNKLVKLNNGSTMMPHIFHMKQAAYQYAPAELVKNTMSERLQKLVDTYGQEIIENFNRTYYKMGSWKGAIAAMQAVAERYNMSIDFDYLNEEVLQSCINDVDEQEDEATYTKNDDDYFDDNVRDYADYADF